MGVYSPADFGITGSGLKNNADAALAMSQRADQLASTAQNYPTGLKSAGNTSVDPLALSGQGPQTPQGYLPQDQVPHIVGGPAGNPPMPGSSPLSKQALQQSMAQRYGTAPPMPGGQQPPQAMPPISPSAPMPGAQMAQPAMPAGDTPQALPVMPGMGMPQAPQQGQVNPAQRAAVEQLRAAWQQFSAMSPFEADRQLRLANPMLNDVQRSRMIGGGPLSDQEVATMGPLMSPGVPAYHPGSKQFSQDEQLSQDANNQYGLRGEVPNATASMPGYAKSTNAELGMEGPSGNQSAAYSRMMMVQKDVGSDTVQANLQHTLDTWPKDVGNNVINPEAYKTANLDARLRDAVVSDYKSGWTPGPKSPIGPWAERMVQQTPGAEQRLQTQPNLLVPPQFKSLEGFGAPGTSLTDKMQQFRAGSGADIPPEIQQSPLGGPVSSAAGMEPLGRGNSRANGQAAKSLMDYIPRMKLAPNQLRQITDFLKGGGSEKEVMADPSVAAAAAAAGYNRKRK